MGTWGMRVTGVEDGKLALDACAVSPAGSFDFILMDLRMPVMDGLEATVRIRKLPAYAHTPIIAITANTSADDKQACFDAGMSDFLSKPVQLDKLQRILTPQPPEPCPPAKAQAQAQASQSERSQSELGGGGSPGEKSAHLAIDIAPQAASKRAPLPSSLFA